jgi:hypothetical protein
MLLSLIYIDMLKNKVGAKITLWSFPFLTLCCSILFQPITEYQSSVRVVGGVLMISFALMYFWQIYLYLPAENLVRFLKGWINIAVFCYFSFNVFLFACGNYIFQNESTVVAMAFWSFHNINNIIKNCLFAVGHYLGTDGKFSKPKNQIHLFEND